MMAYRKLSKSSIGKPEKWILVASRNVLSKVWSKTIMTMITTASFKSQSKVQLIRINKSVSSIDFRGRN